VFGIFFFLTVAFYGPRTLTQPSSITLKDFVDVFNEPSKKRRRILKKHESRCRAILENLFKAPFTSVRPDFLKYPVTGKNLELDGYNEELNLAFEYQGVQHRKFCPLFHETYQDFVDQLKRDAFKKKRCEELGINVLYIPDTVPYDDLEEYLKMNLKQFSLE
jgi:hypothetical protein